jgi:hypothetical protein
VQCRSSAREGLDRALCMESPSVACHLHRPLGSRSGRAPQSLNGILGNEERSSGRIVDDPESRSAPSGSVPGSRLIGSDRDCSWFARIPSQLPGHTHSGPINRVCRKCAMHFGPMCAKVRLFNTGVKRFRAGLVLGKVLICIGEIRKAVLRDRPTLNQ